MAGRNIRLAKAESRGDNRFGIPAQINLARLPQSLTDDWRVRWTISRTFISYDVEVMRSNTIAPSRTVGPTISCPRVVNT